MREVIKKLGISRSSLYEKLSVRSPRYDKDFPRPIKLGKSTIGFDQGAIQRWIQTRIAASR
jgi:prophage regulatory protein